jgi:hypothetical protein
MRYSINRFYIEVRYSINKLYIYYWIANIISPPFLLGPRPSAVDHRGQVVERHELLERREHLLPGVPWDGTWKAGASVEKMIEHVVYCWMIFVNVLKI